VTSRSVALSFVILGCLTLQAQTQTPPAPQQPIFRSGTNFVRVDAYPMKDGRIVTNLEKNDFQIFEDGKPQQIDTFELIKIEPFTPETEKRDPNTQAEGNQLAADSKNRLFVVYLDQLHVSYAGAHRTRQPLVQALNRIMSPTDLFGVMTPAMSPREMVFGRKTLTAEDMLARYWPWGSRDSILIPKEDEFIYPCTINPNTLEPYTAVEGVVRRPLLDLLLERRHEDKVFEQLEGLIAYLGSIRETRTSLIVFTEGWRAHEPDIQLASHLTAGTSMPIVSIAPGGRPTLDNNPNTTSLAQCSREVQRLAMLDNRTRLRGIISAANRANVVFYPVNPAGLVVFDYPINQKVVPTNQGTRDNPSGSVLLQDQERVKARAENAIELANNTGGIAVVNTNDLEAGLDRIANQLSAYYVLGYYSTNSKADGKYRKIEVKLKVPGVQVAARRGYQAMSEAEMTASRLAASTPAPVGPPAGLTAALGTLSQVRPMAELYGYGVQTSPRELTLVAEVATGLAEAGKWMQGGEVQAVVTSPTGEPAGTGRARLDPGNRGALIKVALPAGSPAGPWQARIRLRAEPEVLETTMSIQPMPKAILGPPVVYRAAPGAQSALRPVADLLFYRTERVHVEWTSSAPLESRQARLLDRMGAVLPVEVTVGEKPGAALVADLNLAPLSLGDYVIELKVAAAGASETTYVAVRVRK
jgi:VWFA-related protein